MPATAEGKKKKEQREKKRTRRTALTVYSNL